MDELLLREAAAQGEEKITTLDAVSEQSVSERDKVNLASTFKNSTPVTVPKGVRQVSLSILGRVKLR